MQPTDRVSTGLKAWQHSTGLWLFCWVLLVLFQKRKPHSLLYSNLVYYYGSKSTHSLHSACPPKWKRLCLQHYALVVKGAAHYDLFLNIILLIHILSIFINNLWGDKYYVIWCLYDPRKIKKTLGAIHILHWFKLWIASGVFCFPWVKEKTPSGISPGVFCFPRITLKSQCTDFENYL